MKLRQRGGRRTEGKREARKTEDPPSLKLWRGKQRTDVTGQMSDVTRQTTKDGGRRKEDGMGNIKSLKRRRKRGKERTLNAECPTSNRENWKALRVCALLIIAPGGDAGF
jgi:hypothetical protein